MLLDSTRVAIASNPDLTIGDKFFTQVLSEKVNRYSQSDDFHYVGEDEASLRATFADLRWLVTSLDFSLMESPAMTTAFSNALSIPFNLGHLEVIPWYVRAFYRLKTKKGKMSHTQSWKEYVELAFMERCKSDGLQYNEDGTPVFNSEARELKYRWPAERVRALAYPGAIDFMNTLFASNRKLEAIVATEDIEPIAKHIMRLMIDFEHPELAEDRISFEAYNTANNERDSFLVREIYKRMQQGGKMMYIWDNEPEGQNIIKLKGEFGSKRVIGLRVAEPGQKIDGQFAGATDIAVYKNFEPLMEYLPGQISA